jgi:hypothetical protein
MHNAGMGEGHPFTFKIEPDALTERRYRWTIREGDRIDVRSPHPYATTREAELEAKKALARRVALWGSLGRP